MIRINKLHALCLLFLLLLKGHYAFAKPTKHRKHIATTHKPIRFFAEKLMDAYPDFIIGYEGNNIVWKDSTLMPFGTFETTKTNAEMLNNPTLADQFSQNYTKGKASTVPEKFIDPGRIRYEPFFYKMYGKSERQVRTNLVQVTWCPKLSGQKILVTKLNGIDKKVKAISRELDRHPELKPYIAQIGGTFYWRTISGSNRQSAHSYGSTIDLNGKASNYWQWECRCNNEDKDLTYKNQIPQIIIDIFEKYGFIWGGKWYHFDTMHFEYRPELL